MTAKIFNFRSIRIRLATSTMTPVYGVVSALDTLSVPVGQNDLPQKLPAGTAPSEVSVVVLTIQCANITGAPGVGPIAQPVNVSSMIANTSDIPGTTRMLVNAYPVIANNSFDPLSGNLILTARDVLYVQSSVAGGIDVTIGLLEIANATGS